MRNYVAYLTPQEDLSGKTGIVVTESKLENSLYYIEGYRPSFLDVIFIKGIPKSEKNFYELLWNTFGKKSIILDGEVEEFCERYNFILEKLDEA